MNKNDLHQKILEKMSSQGIDISNIDQEKCGVIKNHYHVLNKRGDLLLRFNINKLNKTKAKLNPKTKSNFIRLWDSFGNTWDVISIYNINPDINTNNFFF